VINGAVQNRLPESYVRQIEAVEAVETPADHRLGLAPPREAERKTS
jgi:hypothetical protein